MFIELYFGGHSAYQIFQEKRKITYYYIHSIQNEQLLYFIIFRKIIICCTINGNVGSFFFIKYITRLPKKM